MGRNFLLLISLLAIVCAVNGQGQRSKPFSSEHYELIDEVMSGVDHYRTLELPETATKQDIKKAFRTLSMIYHPDKIEKSKQTPETADKFISIARANVVLSDPDLREKYDDFRKNGIPWDKRYYGRWAHYYGAPDHDPRYVFGVLTVLITGIHFYLKRQRYYRIVGYAKKTNRYIQQAKRLKQEQSQGGADPGKDEPEVTFSGLSKPGWRDLLPVAVTIWTWNTVSYLTWYVVFILILRRPYDAKKELLKKHNITEEEYDEMQEKWKEQMEKKRLSGKAKRMRRLTRRYYAGTL